MSKTLEAREADRLLADNNNEILAKLGDTLSHRVKRYLQLETRSLRNPCIIHNGRKP